MVITAIKTTYRKLEPRIVYYRDFKFFCNDTFKNRYKKLFYKTQELDVMKFLNVLQLPAIKF